MKAALLKNINSPLEVIDIDDPEVVPGSVKVKVLASHLMSYTKEVFSGKAGRNTPPVPFIPGLSAIGIIEEFGDDVYGLQKGQMVFCEPVKTTVTNRIETESMLIGWFGMTPHANFLLDHWKNGSLAEKAIYPVECVTPIANEEKKDITRLALLNILTVAYGAILTSGFKPGQSVIVNGATGNIGACSAVLLLALGATNVIVAGREANVLNQLAAIDRRVKPYVLTGNIDEDTKNIASVCERRHILLDHSAAPIHDPTLSCINALSNNGTAVFAGGVRADIPITYSRILQRQLTLKGSYMYPTSAPTDLLRMIGSGQIDLDLFKPHAFTLNQVNDAVEKAASFKGLESCVIRVANC